VISFGSVAIFAFYPQLFTSGLMWRVPYDNQSRAAGPVGIGYPPQQIASQYKAPVKTSNQAKKSTIYQQNMALYEIPWVRHGELATQEVDHIGEIGGIAVSPCTAFG
jgi:hypothetical protein